MRRHPFFLIGWLLAATVLLSLAGLTAEPQPAAAIEATTTVAFEQRG